MPCFPTPGRVEIWANWLTLGAGFGGIFSGSALFRDGIDPWRFSARARFTWEAIRAP